MASFNSGFKEIFLGRPAPDHPPYQFIIPNAIKQLNEEGGSSMVTISKFIRENHKNLPWHHEALVKHHLGKLCECGNLIEIHEKCDSIAKASSSCNLRFRVKRKGKNPKENARGIKLHRKKVVSLGRGRGWPRSQGKGKGRGRGRGRGQNLGWDSDSKSLEEEEIGVGVSQVENKVTLHHMEATQRPVMLKEEANEKGVKENARRVKLHRKCKEVGGLGQGRSGGWSLSGGTGKDQGRGRSLCRDSDNGSPEEQVESCVGQGEDKVSVDHMEATEKQYVTVKDEADEKVQSKGQYQVQGSEDSLNDRSQAAQRAIISEIEPLKQDHRVNEKSSSSQQEKELVRADNSSRSRTTCRSHRKTFISNEEQEQNEIDLRSSRRVKGRGRLCTIDMQKEETGKKMEQLMEAAETGALRVEKQLETEEESQPREDLIAVIPENYLNNDNTWLVEEGDGPQSRFAGNRGFMEANRVDALDQVPKLSTYGIFPNCCPVDSTIVQELLTDDIPLVPEWPANDTPALPGLSADAPLVPDFSVDDIPLMVIKDEAAKENLQKKEHNKIKWYNSFDEAN